jgi:hypothetical protein
VHVFRRDGSYEKTIKPFPANLPFDRIKATGAFRDRDGRLIPLIHRPLGLTFYPYEDVEQQPAVTPDGRVLLACVPAQLLRGDDTRAYWPADDPHLAVLDGEGGVPHATYAGPVLGAGYCFAAGGPALAAGSDGKSCYLVGLGPKATKKITHNTGSNLPVVHRIPLPERGPAEVFFGQADRAGADERHLSDPRGIAADGKGLLFVADFGNNRVVVLNEKDASFAGSFPVEAPAWVGVSARTGAIYVHSEKILSGKRNAMKSEDHIVKFASWRQPKETCRFRLPVRGSTHSGFRWSFAVDGSSEPAVLWVGMNMGRHYWHGKGDVLLRCEDRGGSFSDLQKAGYYDSPIHRNLSVDPLGREVACLRGSGCSYAEKLLIQNDATGELRGVKLVTGRSYALGPGGKIYGTDHFDSGVSLHEPDGKQVPFPAAGTEAEKDKRKWGRLTISAGSGTKPPRPGVCVDRRGNLYVRTREAPRAGETGKGHYQVDVFSPEGKHLRRVIREVTSRTMVGPRVDAAGNIYIADAISPPGKPRYPEDFEPHLKNRGTREWYTYMYGSVVKFGPEGGAVWPPRRDGRVWQPGRPNPDAKLDDSLKQETMISNFDKEAVLQGAKWWRFGFSSINNMNSGGTQGDEKCNCTPNDFDVDDFGRVFYPDQGHFRIVVLDTGGNELRRFGEYGNQDCWGPGSYVLDPEDGYFRPRKADDPKDLLSPFAEPEIPLGWVVGVAVTDRYAYVADALNRRVLRVKLGYAASETAAVQ